MNWSKVGWFLLGTFAGWLVLFLVVTFGGVALSMVLTIAPLLIPVFAIIGIVLLVKLIIDKDRGL